MVWGIGVELVIVWRPVHCITVRRKARFGASRHEKKSNNVIITYRRVRAYRSILLVWAPCESPCICDVDIRFTCMFGIRRVIVRLYCSNMWPYIYIPVYFYTIIDSTSGPAGRMNLRSWLGFVGALSYRVKINFLRTEMFTRVFSFLKHIWTLFQA